LVTPGVCPAPMSFCGLVAGPEKDHRADPLPRSLARLLLSG